MSTELEQRVRAAVRDLAGAVPVVSPPPAAVRARARQRRYLASGHRPALGWLAPAFAAAAVLVLVAVVAVVPGWFHPPPPAEPSEASVPGAPPVLPERFAGLSWRTASVTDSPPGPAIAAFFQGSLGDEVLVVVGVDGRTYRKLDGDSVRELSHGRADWVRDLVLSPDGTRLAGIDSGYVIDLRTGEGDLLPLLPGDTRDRWSSALLLGWSPDSRELAYQTDSGVVLHHLATGESRRIPVGEIDRPVGLAFAPDGSGIALATGDDIGTVVVMDRSFIPQRELRLRWPTQRLAGRGTGWSPDGATLVVHNRPGELGFIDATGAGTAFEDAISWGRLQFPELLGWRSDRGMLVALVPSGAEGSGRHTVIVEVTESGMVERSRFAGAVGAQLASGLLAEADFRDPGRPRHGTLPVEVLWGAGAAVAAGLAILAAVVRRRAMRARA